MVSEQQLRKKLVETLRKSGALREAHVAEAFATVPRHVFVPGTPLKEVYSDRAIVTKAVDGVGVSSSSQPGIMAVMLEQLELETGLHVLEVGAGTGYNAALISHMVGPRGRVTSIDIDTDTARAARRHLREARDGKVSVVAADGGYGHKPRAPYDRIIATAGCWQIPQAWVDQLSDGGMLVLPFRLNGVHIGLALRKEGRELVSTSAVMCGFMPMRGAFGPGYSSFSVDGALVASDTELAGTIRRTLDRTLGAERRVRASYPRGRDARNVPLHYLALQGKPIIGLFRGMDWAATPFGLVSPRSVIALPWTRPPRGRLPLFGSDEALDYLREALERWVEEGRPDLRHLHVRVRASARQLGPLPRRSGDRYRFGRGDHKYELWFAR